MQDLARQRLLDLEGCLNFRDLGGYRTADGRRTRWGRLFRSDALHHMTPRDVALVRDELGIRTVVDLRSTAERAGEPVAELCAPPIRAYHIPLFDRERTGPAPALPLDQLYFGLLAVAREPMARIVRVLADATAPALVHCAAGKDRTGLVAAVVLGALGVREEEIVEDYAATRLGLERIVDRLRASASYDFVFSELPPDTLHAEPETMERLLAHVARDHGSMRGYLLGSGVTEAELAALEASLLDEKDTDRVS
jgi:protein tyrosine/serine phosphatase